MNHKRENELPEGFEPAYAPFSHSDTEQLEAYRVYAQRVAGPLEKDLINSAVDAARATLEGLRFAVVSRNRQKPRPSYPNVIVFFSKEET